MSQPTLPLGLAEQLSLLGIEKEQAESFTHSSTSAVTRESLGILGEGVNPTSPEVEKQSESERLDTHGDTHGTSGEQQTDKSHSIPCTEVTVPRKYSPNIDMLLKKAEENSAKIDDGTLFYIFYNMAQEYQIFASVVLHKREWRFHKVQRYWIKRLGDSLEQISQVSEKATYYVFEPTQWRLLRRTMTVLYKDVEKRPIVAKD